MNRRLVLAAVGAVLAASTAAPAFAAKTAPCATFADPKGDTSPGPDPALDITSVTYKTVGKSLTGVITLDKASAHPAFAPGNRFELNFKVAGHDVTIYYKNSATRDAEANAFYQQGLRVDGTFVTDAVEGKIDGNTVTLSATYAELKGAVGAKVMGAAVTGLQAAARASYVATNQTFDTADGGALTYVGGAACK